MAFDWSTFVLEAVNFLVLIWILRHFLYRPVAGAIARRKAAVEQTLAAADTRRTEAERLKQQYESRLAEWEREKTGLRSQAVAEVETQRAQLMTGLQRSVEQERERNRLVERRHLAELRDKAAREAAARSLQFVARLLARIATAGLEAELVRVALEDLSRLDSNRADALAPIRAPNPGSIDVRSAFPLPAAQREQVRQALRRLTGTEVAGTFECDERLIAGLRIGIGPLVLRANLQDELQFFAEHMDEHA
jgi:F-type H+-transporting ATPase subunit b